MAIKSNQAIKISQKHLLGIQDLSINVSPFLIAELLMFIDMTSAPSLLPANSMEL